MHPLGGADSAMACTHTGGEERFRFEDLRTRLAGWPALPQAQAISTQRIPQARPHQRCC